MTKPIVAIATMQLVEKNLIQLDDPINYYLPEFTNLKVLKNEKEIRKAMVGETSMNKRNKEKIPLMKDNEAQNTDIFLK